MGRGSLTVIGTGIAGVAHLTLEAVSAIETADEVYFLVADGLTRTWIFDKRPDAKSLFHHYQEGTNRIRSYEGMAEEIHQSVRQGKTVTAAFYGHPGIFVAPSHMAIRRARNEGFDARMLPGISAESCLVADLGIDPGEEGWQSIEATNYLIFEKDIDVTSPLVIWQIGVIGELRFSDENVNSQALDGLKEKLLALYPASHRICVYEASEYVVLPPKLLWIRLEELSSTTIGPISTLFIPSLRKAAIDRDQLKFISGANQ